jgi:hypothetical protein
MGIRTGSQARHSPKDGKLTCEISVSPTRRTFFAVRMSLLQRAIPKVAYFRGLCDTSCLLHSWGYACLHFGSHSTKLPKTLTTVGSVRSPSAPEAVASMTREISIPSNQTNDLKTAPLRLVRSALVQTARHSVIRGWLSFHYNISYPGHAQRD